MGLFSKLKDIVMSKFDGHSDRSEAAASSPSRTTTPSPTPSPVPIQKRPDTAQARNVPVSTPPRRKLTTKEVSDKLDEMAADHPEDLAWRTSIVDLMKLVGMDSSFAERKEMALDLGYTQEDIDKKGSADMNIWLHKQVMVQLAEDLDGDVLV